MQHKWISDCSWLSKEVDELADELNIVEQVSYAKILAPLSYLRCELLLKMILIIDFQRVCNTFFFKWVSEWVIVV